MSWQYLNQGSFENKGIDNTLSAMLGANPQTRTTHVVTTGGPGPAGVKFDDPAALDAVVNEYGKDKGNINWALFDYKGEGVLGITKKGVGLGVPPREVQNDLDDNKVQFLLMTVMQGVKSYGVWRWIGPKAPAAIQKASEAHGRGVHQILAELLMKHHKAQLQSGELRG